MKLKFITCLAVAAISMQVMSQTTPETVAKVIQTTGLNDQMQQLDFFVKSGIEQKKASFTSPEQYEQFKTAITSGLNSNNAEKFVTEYLEKYANEDSMKMILKLYSNPFMQEFNRIEKEAASPSHRQDQLKYFQSLKTNMPSKTRIKEIITLNEEMQTSEIAYNIFHNIVIAVMRGANLTQPKEKQMSDTDINKAIEAALPPNFKQMIINQMLAVALYTYKDVPDKKLDRYIDVWNEPVGKYCTKEFMQAYNYAFVNMSEIIGRSLGTMVKK